MTCEKCGKELQWLNVDIFNRNGSDDFYEHAYTECEEDAVFVDVSPDWVGDGLSEEELPDTIRCPHCKQFPFINTEVQVHHFVRLVCFKSGGADSAAD